MSIEFLEMLGARTADARKAASRIAKLEMEFLLDIETTGRCKILQKLISLGCPITTGINGCMVADEKEKKGGWGGTVFCFGANGSIY